MHYANPEFCELFESQELASNHANLAGLFSVNDFEYTDLLLNENDFDQDVPSANSSDCPSPQSPQDDYSSHYDVLPVKPGSMKTIIPESPHTHDDEEEDCCSRKHSKDSHQRRNGHSCGKKRSDFASEDEWKKYRLRRDRNNKAAIQSRQRKRDRADLAIDRADLLEKENETLNFKITAMNKEVVFLRSFVTELVKSGRLRSEDVPNSFTRTH